MPPIPNRVRLSSAAGYRLIDLDCVNKIGEPVGAKEHNSSAYAPPEMLFRDGSAILLKDVSNTGIPGYEDLPASSTYDIWSFGAMLFEALALKTLFEVRQSIIHTHHAYRLYLLVVLPLQHRPTPRII